MSARALTGRLLIAAASVALTLGALELAFRLKDLRGFHAPRKWDLEPALLPKEQRVPGVSVQYRPHATFTFTYDGDPRGYFGDGATISYHMNGLGFRGPEPSEAKFAGVPRILLLGDSFTFGEGVKLEDTFAARLPALLGGNVEVMAFGTGGWSTVDEISYYQQVGVRFHPDLVVVVYVPNDADAPGLDLLDEFRAMYEARRFRWSYLASYLEAGITRYRLGRAYMQKLVDDSLESRKRWNKSFRHLSHGKATADAEGSRFLVVLFPFMFDLTDTHPMIPIHERVEAHCRESGIPFMDLLPVFKGRSYTKLWVHPTDQHPNEEAHRIAAEALATHIRGARLLP